MADVGQLFGSDSEDEEKPTNNQGKLDSGMY